MYFYAQLNSSGVCFAVTQTSGPIDAPDMIPLDSYDVSYLDRTYANGAWQ